MRLIEIEWTAADGELCVSRFNSEYDAIRFEESLDAEGLPHVRLTQPNRQGDR